MKKQTKKQNVGAGPVSAQKKEGGITLIALVITIIVMLILVAVTISIATNGELFTYAKRAADETNTAIGQENQILSGMLDGKTINDIVNESVANNSYGLVDENTFIGQPTDAPYSVTIGDSRYTRTQNGNETYANGYKFTNGTYRHFLYVIDYEYYDNDADNWVTGNVYICWDDDLEIDTIEERENTSGNVDVYNTSGIFLSNYDYHAWDGSAM